MELLTSLAILYCLPTIGVVVRGASFADAVWIGGVNLLLGWTLIGWIAALAMAIRHEKPHV